MTSWDGERIEAIRHQPISPQEKGFGGPLHSAPTTAHALAALAPPAGAGWLGSPRALIRQSALHHNIATMAGYCADRGIELYPHGKTTMAPQVVAAQLAAGARGVTVATVTQARVFRAFGLTEILIANEVTDRGGASWLAETAVVDQAVTVTCYVDSVAGVQLLDAAVGAGPTDRRLPVLVELGHAEGRTGARSIAEACAVAQAVTASRGLRLVGVAGYEGSISRATVDETLAAARAYCQLLGELTTELVSGGHLSGRPVISAGGSAYFDAVVDVLATEAAWTLVLRSGCYVTHDHGLYRSVSPFERGSLDLTLRPALEVWAPVISRPDRETVVIGAGRRDVSSDSGLPVLLQATQAGAAVDVSGAEARRLFDQHLVVSVPHTSVLRPGDEVQLGVSHPCTTFDKWRWLPVVDDEDRIVDVVRTHF